MWKTILDIFFPILCLGCGQEGDFVCPTCFKKLPLNNEPPQNNLLIASHYNHPLIKQIILRYKYDFVQDLAQPLSLLMIKRLKRLALQNDVPRGRPSAGNRGGLPFKMMSLAEQGRHFKGDASGLILIPVPLHKKRLRWRGFNQAELLAQHIGQALNIPIASNILTRTKHTKPQVKLQTPIARKQNISQAFELRTPKRLVIENDVPSRRIAGRASFSGRASGFIKGDASGFNFKNKTLILIDDVTTTGATLDQAAQTLRLLNPKQIWKLVIARG